MPDEPTQFAWPMSFAALPDATVAFAEIEQDTTDDLKASAAVVLCTPKGANLDDATFGVDQLVFQDGPLDTDRLAADLQQADNRLTVDVDELIDLADATRRVVNVSVEPST